MVIPVGIFIILATTVPIIIGVRIKRRKRMLIASQQIAAIQMMNSGQMVSNAMPYQPANYAQVFPVVSPRY